MVVIGVAVIIFLSFNFIELKLLTEITKKKKIDSTATFDSMTRIEKAGDNLDEASGDKRDGHMLGHLPPEPESKSVPTLKGIEQEQMNRFVVIPEYKLLFCYVEKVGCSMFNDIFRFLRAVHPDVSTKEKAFQRREMWYRNTPGHHNLTVSDVETLHTDPGWTKAVFFRDPASRFLSAFRSKCMEPIENHGRRCRQMFRLWKRPLDNFTFDDALDAVAADPDIVQHQDPHSMVHANLCGGLQNTLPRYSYVRQLKESTATDTIGTLLLNVGVPEHIIHGITDCFVRRKNCTMPQSLAPGFPLYRYKRKHAHNTGSNHNGVLLNSYKTDERLKIIQKAYQVDYDLFNYPQLSLKELEEAGA